MLPNDLKEFIERYSDDDLLDVYQDYLALKFQDYVLDHIFMCEFERRELFWRLIQIRGDSVETNSDGLIAIAHWNSNGSIEEVDGISYSWTPKYGVSLCWVSPKHLDRILRIRVQACCGIQKQKYNIATPNQVKVWNMGHY